MTSQLTREDIRIDILEITTTAVEKAIKANNQVLLKRINEDFAATNRCIDNLGHRMDKRFKKIDHRFDILEVRVDTVEQKIDHLDHRVEKLEVKVDQLDQRVGGLEQKTEILEHKIENLQHAVENLGSKIDFTHKLLQVHIANPSAHTRPH